MPAADEVIENQSRISALVYGPAKSRKTWWALRAAEAGFRVLMFSFERGHGIVQQISPEARKRIYILDLHDGPTDGFASLAATMALKEFNFYLNEKERKVALRPIPGSIHVDMRNFGADTVVVWDTYTALAVSTIRQFAYENNIDLSDANKTEWDGYGWCGRLLTWMLVQMRALPCHSIVVGHETSYEKYKKDPRNPRKQGPLEYQRRQPLSSSNPHGMTIARDFDNVLYMYIEGRSNWIDTRGNKLEDAGSRIVPPERYGWEDLNFGALAQAAHIPLPSEVAPFDFPLAEARAAQPAKSTPLIGGATKPGVLNMGKARASILS